MARRGVWELKEVFLRYSLEGGSSRGVRDFIEKDIVAFAKANPQVKVITKLRNTHPNVTGRYITGYARQLDLRNHDRESVAARFQYLRDTFGSKLPTHNRIGMGVVNAERHSIQGVWHTPRNLAPVLHPHEVELREQREREYGFSKLMKEVGVSGVLQVSMDLLEEQRKARDSALAKLKKTERVMPTE